MDGFEMVPNSSFQNGVNWDMQYQYIHLFSNFHHTVVTKGEDSPSLEKCETRFQWVNIKLRNVIYNIKIEHVMIEW